MSLTCQIQITLNNMSREKIETIKRALEPDNVDFPENQSLHIQNVGSALVFNFQGRGNMGSLIGTVDEILGHIQVSLEVMK